MSSSSSKQKLLNLLSTHTRLLKQMLRPRPLLRGSFHQVYTRCGKSNCWCAKAKRGHPHARLTWSQDGTMMTRKVGAAEQKAVIQLTENYKQFSEQRQQLTALQLQIKQRLDAYEEALINQTRKPLGFTAKKSPLSAKNKSALQTRQRRRS